MGENSAISWTHHTFNPWEGCAKVSPGCKHCYAEKRNERFHAGEHWGVHAPRLMRSENNWRQPLKWNRDAKKSGERRRVFCASLADVFEDRSDLVEPRARLFRLIEETEHLDWLLLTKRPENMVRLAPPAWRDAWPVHVWAGATAEDQEHLVRRWEHLRHVPARIRFISAEPLIGPLDIYDDPTPDWVIVGGESHPTNARPFHIGWARNILSDRDTFQPSMRVFVKQFGSRPVDFADDDCVEIEPPHWETKPILLRGKGDDPRSWPEDLRVQEVPT